MIPKFSYIVFLSHLNSNIAQLDFFEIIALNLYVFFYLKYIYYKKNFTFWKSLFCFALIIYGIQNPICNFRIMIVSPKSFQTEKNQIGYILNKISISQVKWILKTLMSDILTDSVLKSRYCDFGIFFVRLIMLCFLKTILFLVIQSCFKIHIIGKDRPSEVISNSFFNRLNDLSTHHFWKH